MLLHTRVRVFCLIADTVRAVQAKELALIVPKNINNFPHNKERLNKPIDIWWIVRILTQSKIGNLGNF